jgi:hypothetical protein
MIKYIKNKIFRHRAVKAMKKAREIHKLTGRTMMVILWKGRPIVMAKQELKLWINTRKLQKGVTIRQIESTALYISK